jgi:hypothetical protein
MTITTLIVALLTLVVIPATFLRWQRARLPRRIPRGGGLWFIPGRRGSERNLGGAQPVALATFRPCRYETRKRP